MFPGSQVLQAPCQPPRQFSGPAPRPSHHNHHCPLQLAGREELAPLQAGQLYTLPSMQFLENMLSDFDSKTGSSGGSGSGGVHGSGSGVGGPLDLPGDAFDLPDFHNNPQAAAAQQQQQQSLRATPFDQQQQLLHQQQGAAAAQQQQQQQLGAAGYGGFVPLGGSAPAGMQVQLGQASLHSSSSLTLHASMRAHSAYAPGQMMQHHLGDHQLLLIQQQQQQQLVQQRREGPSLAAAAAVRQPAVPQPAQPRATPRRQAQAYADFDYEEAEVSLQTSKSGRVRKVSPYWRVLRWAASAVAGRGLAQHCALALSSSPHPATTRLTCLPAFTAPTAARLPQVASFTGVKRRLDVAGHGGGNTVRWAEGRAEPAPDGCSLLSVMGRVTASATSAPAPLPALTDGLPLSPPALACPLPACSESRDSRGSIGGADVSSGEVGSKGSKGSRKAGVSAKGERVPPAPLQGALSGPHPVLLCSTATHHRHNGTPTVEV